MKDPPAEREQFPVCKVAANDKQRQLIADEFEILRDLGSSAAPVVQVHPEPLVDGKGIFGFRMEKLLAIGLDMAIEKSGLVKCLEQIHEKGIVHNDFHPLNVMMNAQEQLVVIDFACSGRVGSTIPPEKRAPWWSAEVYSFEADHISLNKFFKFSACALLRMGQLATQLTCSLRIPSIFRKLYCDVLTSVNLAAGTVL
ncbi:hypothetical protein N656DRAFT_365419 [Canariomyces notabilis]|uniref:ABC1 atypical kinase-like domain-containing protein n=1 Tax=Canariomyces notabilis TaxID=2074819 RepID=A0AAN6QG12_9PEZI|nr:hypothetical protein N656DRAFT_365419 [Canariomyces arenarius]